MFNKVFTAPGSVYSSWQRSQIDGFLNYMMSIRDDSLYEYPILPGAVSVFQEIVSGREAKVTAKTAAAAQRAVDWINDTRSALHTGMVEYGHEPFLRRRSLDYLVLGRTLLYAPPNEPMQYLDPAYVRFRFDQEGGVWYDRYTGVEYNPRWVIADHPRPIGGSGRFTSPVFPLIPTAILAWLVREHDSASADGRKVRDILIVGSAELATSLEQAVKDSIAAWAGVQPNEHGVPIVWMDRIEGGALSVEDYMHTLSLANIPKDFPREMFEFNFANEISANLGVALRHFYNSERATNRALEEIQEARQQQKGPNLFTRTEERLMNRPGMINRFGRSVRFGFIETADHATQRSRGEVLGAYSEALQRFAQVFNGQVNGRAFLAWLQNDSILPADLELITDVGSMVMMDTPRSQAESATVDAPADLIQSSKAAEIDYDEVSIDLNGRLIERRASVFPVQKWVENALKDDLNILLTPIQFDLTSAIDTSRKKHYSLLMQDTEAASAFAKAFNVDLANYEALDEDVHRLIADWVQRNAGRNLQFGTAEVRRADGV